VEEYIPILTNSYLNNVVLRVNPQFLLVVKQAQEYLDFVNK